MAFLKRKDRQSERGNSMIETLPILVVFTVLITYGLGFFGIVHTGILNSIGSRTYAFETFRNRADLRMFRDEKTDEDYSHYAKIGNRFHTINSENTVDGSLGEGQFASSRPLAFPPKMQASDAKQSDHNTTIYTLPSRNRTVGVSPAWVMVGYGICIDADCGDGRKTYEYK